jgi:hypothetical protein
MHGEYHRTKKGQIFIVEGAIDEDVFFKAWRDFCI